MVIDSYIMIIAVKFGLCGIALIVVPSEYAIIIKYHMGIKPKTIICAITFMCAKVAVR